MNNGECENYYDLYICHCSIGFTGHKCQQNVLFDNPKAVSFKRQSFVSFDNLFLSNNEYIDVNFKIKTYGQKGLLFFQGPTELELENGNADYLVVFINDSRIEMIFELGSGIGHVMTDIYVDDGKTYTIAVELHEQEGTIKVNDKKYFGRSPGMRNTLNADGDIYFGGVPANFTETILSNLDLGHYVGCIFDIAIGTINEIDIVNSSKRSRNLMPCDT